MLLLGYLSCACKCNIFNVSTTLLFRQMMVQFWLGDTTRKLSWALATMRTGCRPQQFSLSTVPLGTWAPAALILLWLQVSNRFHKGRSRRCNFSPWDKGQCPHGALFHAVPGCCKCFQQCRVARTARLGTLGSYPTLLEALATPWDSVEQCSMRTLPLVPSSKVASCGPTLIELESYLQFIN